MRLSEMAAAALPAAVLYCDTIPMFSYGVSLLRSHHSVGAIFCNVKHHISRCIHAKQVAPEIIFTQSTVPAIIFFCHIEAAGQTLRSN